MHKSKTLDPVLLGRPLPAFNALAALVSRHVTQQIQQSGHRSLALVIEQAHFAPWRPTAAVPTAHTQVHFTRSSVLALMAQRYGFELDAQPTDTPTRTEERIGKALQDATLSALQMTFKEAQHISATPSTQRWQWLAQIGVGTHAAQALRIELGLAHSAQLEFLVAQQRRRTNRAAAKPEPLQIDLRALLLEKTVTAADIQAMRIGTVLPINLERARVALNGQAMLTASVAEHQGKLHLTAFETLE